MEAVVEKLINVGFECLKDQVTWQTGMKEELERLRENHPKIQSVVSYASTQLQIRDQNPALDKWLWQLRDAVDEADDVLDDFEYKKHEEQLAKNKKQITKVRSIMKSIKKRSVKIVKRALKNDPNLKRLEAVVKKLYKISADVGNFFHIVKDAKQEQQEQLEELCKTRETGSLPKNDLIGRDEYKESVMQWLRKTALSTDHQTDITGTTLHGNISLLSIVGDGGMGKTTLLQHVYDDEMTKEFDLKMWVCVSNNFDVKRVIACMLESLKKKKPDLESLDALQESLKSEVLSKKFLLVLDDIWEEGEERDKSKWENLFAPLAYGSLGSKILVTTRMESVASMIAKVIKKKKETLTLKGLEEDECLQLLNSHAFADVKNPDDHKKLRSIAGEIVKKLSGSPLVAKVIGGVLNSSLDESHWKKILNSDIISAEFGQNDIMPILRLSYIFLPKHLKSCFAFCCIFPQDHEFDKDDLVRMWIALGFVQSSYNREETLEDIGGRYFDVLVKKSFFDKLDTKHYKMHDLLHELAQSVSTHECFRVEGDKEFKIPETVRHLSVKTSNLEVLKKMRKFKNLRTLHISYKKGNQYPIDVLTEIFKASISIRLLYIKAHELEMIPEEIRNLIHLRYLKVDCSRVTKLPRSLSNLYHLQFIITIYTNPGSFLPSDFLPRDMNNLSNLHYLDLPWNKLSGMHGIGKLNSLQKLNGFYVKNKTGYKIGELEHMNDLRQLRIKCLENVNDAEEACSAKLCDKRSLVDLSLEWSDINSQKFIHLDEKVLDKLQPPNCLKNLSIQAYMGAKSAKWMNNAHLIFNLEKIDLIWCFELQTLPPFGQLPFLKYMYLRNMPKVKRLEHKFHGNDKDCVFPSLEVLHIHELEALEDWFDAAVAAAADDCFFPCLTKLSLKSCPNLHELPYLPPKLEILKINQIGWKTLNCCSSISKSIPLITLEVLHCPNITYIPLADEIAKLAALRYLEIRNCPNLISLGRHQEVETSENCQLILSKLTINDPSVLLMEPLRSITSVQELTIKCNDELVSFPNEAEQWFLNVSSSLRELEFEYLKSLQSLPTSLESISSLKILSVHDVPQLHFLPNLPASLERLRLTCLESLQYLPSSWSTISSLKYLNLFNIPHLKSLPDLPPSLCELDLDNLYNLDRLPSCLLSLSSLRYLRIFKVPQLRELRDLPPSLCELKLFCIGNLDRLPSCLPSLSSLQTLDISLVSRLRELPDLPPSLCELKLCQIENLDCLPSCFPSLSSLRKLNIENVPQLRELPDLPPSLCELELCRIENLDCLPSCLPSLSSLQTLDISYVPRLRELPDLPPSLCVLSLYDLENLNCLPSCLPSLSSLRRLMIVDVPQLRELPDLPPSLEFLLIKGKLHPNLKHCSRHKIAHIRRVTFSERRKKN